MILKNTLKKIGKSFGRFASLVAIILIGVGFYAGIRQSMPAIRDVQNQFTADTNMMDLHIVSTLGLTDEDIEELEKLPDVTGVTGGYSKYVYSSEDVIRVMSIDLDIDVYQIKDGKYPIEKNECLADYRFYKVGDLIRITEPAKSSDSDDKDNDEDSDEDENKDDLKIHTFVVSGTVVSPIYMGTDYGSANIGDGELKSYILVKDSAFTYDAYTDIYMTMAKTEEDVPYSDSYNEKLESLKASVEKIKKDRQKAREDGLYEEAKQKAYDKIEEKKGEIEAEVREEVEKEVRKAIEEKQEEQKAKLREQAGKLGTTFEKLVSTLSDKVQSALSPVTDEQVKKQVDEQMDDALATAMDEAREEAVKKIDIPECKWIIQTRNEVVSQYKILVDQYAEVESIADIIPIFFIIIVVLMTSNTMSRMIAEERLEMGTFTSLGYSNASIIGGYMIYVLVATVFGAAGGYLLGVYLLPPFVYACFPVSLPDISFTFRPVMFWSCMAVSFVVMTLVTIVSCLKELKEKPAYLLRPVPPKRGRTLLLEKIGFIWNHITFSWKTTIRNIARYRGRGFMTIIGVGGCTFLMFIGFAIRDCISTVGDKQFDQVLHYDVLAVLGEDVDSFDDIPLKKGEMSRTELSDILVDPLMFRQEVMKVENDENYSLDVYLVIVDDKNPLFEKYMTLREANPRDVVTKPVDGMDIEEGTPLSLGDENVIVTPRIADKMNAGIGASFVMKDEEDNEFEVKVGGVAENYVSNYIYMSDSLYKKVFNKDIKYNALVATDGTGGVALSRITTEEESFFSGVVEQIKDMKDKDSANKADESEGNKSDENNKKPESSELTKKLYKIESFVSVNTTDVVLRRANDAIKGLDTVVVMLVVIASLLAFTVLYNLTAINISERTREIATLKVLGFTPVETNDYIYRETIINGIVGIAAGLLVSPYLHGKVMDVVSVDTLIFLRDIKTPSFVYAAVLSVIFIMVMLVVTFVKLTKIDMIESLKSVD